MLSNNDVLKMIFGFKVRYLRLKMGMGYQELSKQSGLSVSYLNDIEKAKKYPKPAKIQTLADALGVPYDELVSRHSHAKIQPIIDLVDSDFFKYFPLEEFGIQTEKLLDVFTNAPDKIYAFVITIIKMVRSYQIEKEHFYRVALRSYQDMHDNYFAHHEEAAREFATSHDIQKITSSVLEKWLKEQYSVQIDRSALPKAEKLKQFRYYYQEQGKVLFINQGLSPSQETFILARELGFQHLGLDERPSEVILHKNTSFEKLLNNHRASYFAAALILPEQELLADIKDIFHQRTWQPARWIALLDKYQVTPETLLQRLTNLLPAHLGLKHLFFIRIHARQQRAYYAMTKELHLSQLHSPYRNLLKEQFCRRWISIKAIEEVQLSTQAIRVDAQLSSYWGTDHQYFCMTIAQSGNYDSQGSSVTVGLLVTPELRANLHFLEDEKLPRHTVNITCERCAIPDCQERAADPKMIHSHDEEEAVERELAKLGQIHTLA